MSVQRPIRRLLRRSKPNSPRASRGASAVGVLVAGGALLAACSSAPVGLPPTTAFAARPVLCYAPPFSGHDAPGTRAGVAPRCSGHYQLTAAALGVQLDPNSPQGYDVQTVAADPRLADVPSTASAADTPTATVLLTSSGTGTDQRYVLGPAALTRVDVESATASPDIQRDGQWDVNMQLNAQGAARWDHLAARQFHAYVGFVVDNKVVGAPLTLPDQSTYAAFGSEIQLQLSEAQAKALAAQLNS